MDNTRLVGNLESAVAGDYAWKAPEGLNVFEEYISAFPSEIRKDVGNYIDRVQNCGSREDITDRFDGEYHHRKVEAPWYSRLLRDKKLRHLITLTGLGAAYTGMEVFYYFNQVDSRRPFDFYMFRDVRDVLIDGFNLLKSDYLGSDFPGKLDSGREMSTTLWAAGWSPPFLIAGYLLGRIVNAPIERWRSRNAIQKHRKETIPLLTEQFINQIKNK